MTVIYSDYVLTSVTAVLSISTKIVSDLFVVWDPDKVNPLESDLGITNLMISIFILCAFYAVCIIVIHFEKEKNAAAIQKEIGYYHTQQKLKMDELTDIYNRTALRNAFQSMEADASDNGYIFVMADIDNFKALNDTFGHDLGDRCIREFASILKKNCDKDAIPFRFGGDEFCILFKNTALKDVVFICKNIQHDLKNSAVSKARMLVTASVGIAVYEKQMSANQLLRNTDSALYRAKTVKDSIYIYESMERFSGTNENG